MPRATDRVLARAAARVGLEPLTFNIMLFVLCVGVLLNVALGTVLHVPTTLIGVYDFFTFDIGNDSWWPIRAAVRVISIEPQTPVYTTTVFGLQSKFQYPPTSILLLQPIIEIQDLLHRPAAVFKLTCWLATLATVVLMAWMFPRCLAEGLGGRVRLARRDSIVLSATAAVATLTFDPIIGSLSLGQIQTWINFMFCAAAFAWVFGRKDWAGVLVAIICLIKPQLILFVLWAAARKEWRFVLYFAVPFCLVSLISVFVYGVEDWTDYFALLSYVSHRGETFFPNQSINGLLNRMFHNGNNLVWDESAYAPYNFWIYLATTVSSAIMIGFSVLWRRHEHERAPGIDFLLAGLTFTMASPIAWHHHYGAMLPIFALVLPATLALSGMGRRWLIALALSYVVSATPLSFTNRLADTPFNFLQSYVLFAGLVLLVYLYRLRHAQYLARPAPMPAVAEGEAAPVRT